LAFRQRGRLFPRPDALAAVSREVRDPEAQRRAADALEKALKRLKEQPKPKAPTGKQP
jgi:hypothetical protein